MKKFNCPYCNERYYKQDLPGHIDKKHDDMIPENYTAYRLTYDIVNNKQGHGNCTECGKPTKWNEKRQKYERLCGNPKCYARVKETYQKRMLKVYNKVHLLDDPEHQEKMLAHRKISGTYKWSDGKEFTYTGQYEKKLMEFLDKTMEFKSNEILAPGPILEYEFEGQKKHWITDFLIIPHNLIIEVKDGGDNPNKRNMPITRNKTLAKERMITNMGKYNYLRLTNNDFLQLFQMMVELKEKSLEEDDSPLYRIHESVLNESLLNLTFYHASTQVYKDTIPAQAPQLGTKIYDPHWSVYMWSNRENAMIYLIWVGLFKLCKDEEIDFKSISQDLLISPMDKCIYMVHNDKIENLMTRIKGYIYTIKPSILDIPNMRLGHTIYQNEYTINHDAKIKSREFVEIDDNIIKQFIVFVSKETLEKNRDGIRNKTRFSSALFYPRQERSVLNYKYDSLNARGDIDHNKPLAPQLNKDVIAKTDFKRVKEVFDQLPKSEQKLLLSPGRTDYIDSPKSIIRYVYIKDREFVGFAELFDFQNNGNAQLSIAVIPKYRGKDYNIATRLLRTAEEHVLQSDKYNKIVYMVYKDNQRSINFAKKNGYTLEGENNTDYFYTKNIDQDTLTESSGIILNEGIDKKYTRKYKSVDELCEVLKTPKEIADWYFINKIRWTTREERQEYIKKCDTNIEFFDEGDNPILWPDYIVQNHKGICYDHALFMCYCCNKFDLQPYLILVYNMVHPSFSNDNWMYGHAIAGFDTKDEGTFIFDYNPNTGKSLMGPFKNIKEATDRYFEEYNQRVLLQLLGQRQFSSCRVTEKKIFYIPADTKSNLYKAWMKEYNKPVMQTAINDNGVLYKFYKDIFNRDNTKFRMIDDLTNIGQYLLMTIKDLSGNVSNVYNAIKHKVLGEAQSTFENGYIKKIGFMDAKYTYDSLSKKEKILMNSYGNDTTFHDDDKVIARFGYFDSRSIVGMLKREELAGFLELTDYKDGYIYISIVVIPKFRGQGISHKLIDYAEDYARRKGYKNIRYVSNKKNKASQHLVQKREDYKLSDTTRDCYVYDKPLNEEYIQESATDLPWLISDKDIYCNMNSFPDKYNIIFVTGTSGGGKSTLSKKLADQYQSHLIPLDYIHSRSYKIYNMCNCNEEEFKKEYFKKIQDWIVGNERVRVIYNIIDKNWKKFFTMIEQNWKKYYGDGPTENFIIDTFFTTHVFKQLLQFLMPIIENDIDSYVVEGTQCISIVDVDKKYIKYPFVFKGTSIAKASLRRVTRQIDEKGSKYILTPNFRKNMNTIVTMSPIWKKEQDHIRKQIITNSDDVQYIQEYYDDYEEDQQALTEASFIPMEVPDINKEEISMSESKMPLLFSEDDIYCNFKNLDKYHIIFVTGTSGSGKSTLARKIADYYGYAYMSIDVIHWITWKTIFNNRPMERIFNNEQTTDEMRMFLKSKEGKKILDLYKNISMDDIIDENFTARVLQTLIDFCEAHNIPAVLEGTQNAHINLLDPKYKKYPFVFKGTSLAKTFSRRLDRDGLKLKRIGMLRRVPNWYSEMNNIREYIMNSTDDIEYKNENFYNEEALFRETEEYYIQESVEWDSCANMAKNELDKGNDFIEKFFLCTPTETLETHPKSHKEFFSLLQFKPKRKFINKPEEEKKFKRDINGFWIECIMYPGSTKKRKNWNFSSYWIDPDKPSEGWVIGIVKK